MVLPKRSSLEGGEGIESLMVATAGDKGKNRATDNHRQRM